MALYVEGRLHNSSYEKDGQKKTVTEVVVDTLNILTWGKDSSGAEGVQAAEPGEK
jgi:single-stranded DNA-binding protein